MELKFLVYPHEDTVLFRGVEKSKVDRTKKPFTVKFEAFRRKANEEDGPTILPEPCLCFEIKIGAVARIRVSAVSQLHNPENKQPLTVIQDDESHMFIANVPHFIPDGQDEQIQIRRVCWTNLAMQAELLDEVEYEAAKQEWDSRREPEILQAGEQVPQGV